MSKLLELLEKRPEIGMLSSIASAGLSFSNIIAIIKFAGIVVGLAIGLVTLYIKIMQAIKETRVFKKGDKNGTD